MRVRRPSQQRPPATCPALDQLCTCAGIPSGFRMRAPMGKKKSRNPESGDHQGGLKEKSGGWGRRIKASSRLGKEQTLQSINSDLQV